MDRTIKFVWDKCKKNYYDKGIHAFWLDEAEPEFGPYAGISWWTTDIGGFLGGDPEDEEFRELMIRWFQWGAFSTVFRMHGARQPFLQLVEEFRNGVKQFTSGQDNEVWSYGDENYDIFVKYLHLREELKPYLRQCMKDAHETGLPVMRAMFIDFPEDPRCWELEGQYMLGKDILVAPVLNKGDRTRTLYLPSGADWVYAPDMTVYEGGQTVTVDAPLETIPVFSRGGSNLSIEMKNL